MLARHRPRSRRCELGLDLAQPRVHRVFELLRQRLGILLNHSNVIVKFQPGSEAEEPTAVKDEDDDPEAFVEGAARFRMGSSKREEGKG